MNIKDVFKSRKSKENKIVENTNVETKVEKEALDVPKVVFEDLELQVMVGQWLEILPSQKGYGTSVATFYAPLSPEELIKKVNIPTKQLDEIVTKFGLLLKLAGIENKETCTLGQFNKDNFSFNCHLDNSGIDACITLRWGDMIDFNPEFTIDYLNESKTYDYLSETKEKPTRFLLQNYTIKNPENGSSCYRYLSPFDATFIIKNGEYSFSVEIGRPKSIVVPPFSNYVFRLENEDQLHEYLLGLTFPLKIDEVYKKICEISTNSVEEYPSFKIEVKRKLDETHKKTTDMVYLNNGQLNKFTITNDEITVSIDSNESLTISTPFEQYSEVSKKVENARKLTNTMIKNKEK